MLRNIRFDSHFLKGHESLDTISAHYVQDAIDIFEKTRQAAAVAEPNLHHAYSLSESVTHEIERTAGSRTFGVREGLRYAQRLGALAGMFIALEDPGESIRFRTLLASVLAATIVPNRDIACRQAARLNKLAAQEYMGLGRRQEAGVSLTNAAVNLVELRQETPADRAESFKLIERGYKLKKQSGDKIDIAFTLANLASARRKIAEYDNVSPESNFLRAWGEIRSSIKIFDRSGYLNSPNLWSIFTILTDVVVSWVFYEADRRGSSEPDILPSLKVPERRFVRQILNSRIESSVDPDEVAELRWHRYRVDDLMRHGNRLTEDVYINARYLWTKGHHEELIRRGRDFIKPPIVEDQKYADFLTWMTKALYEFRIARDNEDIEAYLLGNAIMFRFVGCSLAELGQYEEGFQALELSRGLSVPSTLDRIDLDSAFPANVTFVHIAHSPDGIACIVANRGESENTYTGRFFDRDMDSFSRTFHEAELGLEPGLIVAQMKGDRTAAVQRAQELCDTLVEVADYIVSECPLDNRLVIVPAGYFQSFPVTSLITSSGETIQDRRDVSTSPSVAAQMASRFGFVMTDVGLILADSAPGMVDLKYSRFDEFAIAQSGFEMRKEIPERGCLISREASYGYLHFSGHSVSSPDPRESHFVLHEGVITAEDVLKGELGAQAVFLSSCQSGMALHMNEEFSEEVLSLQSAFFYTGASVSIGTSWPVLDSAAHVFSFLFYGALPASSDSPEDWLNAFRLAQAGLRGITAGELAELLPQVGHPTDDLPWADANPDCKPFANFYYWAPFTLMLRL